MLACNSLLIFFLLVRGPVEKADPERQQKGAGAFVGGPHFSSTCVLASLGVPGQWEEGQCLLLCRALPGPALGEQVSSDLLVEGNNDTSYIDDTAPASRIRSLFSW